jgi:UDP-glucuronate 4-epimerase
MKVLITGVAGFIGFHLANNLLLKNYEVYGVDNINDYYDPNLKLHRLEILKSNVNYKNFIFERLGIENRLNVENLFNKNNFDIVVNLAAQAGVRYSITNPHAYIESNLVGFINILEGCRSSNVKHLIYASSSSVYGMNIKQPFSSNDPVDNPISLYAATKKSNELIAHTYSHLYNIPTTGLRFFTVYGPFGRPDMAYYKFTKSILNENPIDVYNNGEMQRDFTYIDDIVKGIEKVLYKIPNKSASKNSHAEAPYKIYNIGNNRPTSLKNFIEAIEDACNKKAIKNFMPMQQGDVPITYADIDDLTRDTGFKPSTNIKSGIKNFVSWYKNYHNNQ